VRKAPHYIAIEGPLRVGKTKLASALADHLRGRKILDAEDNQHLKSFYRGRPGAAFRAQMEFLIGRFRQLSESAIEESHVPVVADFMIEKDKLFAYLNLDDDEIAIYDTYYRYFKDQLPRPDLTVYLKATPESIRARLDVDADGFEARISDSYLEGAVRAFDHFFNHYKAADVLVVDAAETDVVSNAKDLENLLTELSKPVTGTQFFLPLGN